MYCSLRRIYPAVRLSHLMRTPVMLMKPHSILFLVAVLAPGAALIGCHGGVAAPARHAVEGGVVTVTPRPVTITTELPGRTSSYRVAEARPQVSGVVVKGLFVEGSEVKAGQALGQLDREPVQAR